jgi:hypothetical protein
MRIVMLMSAALAAWVTMMAPAPAAAPDYPWCAVLVGRFGGARNCGFVSFAQCRAYIHGLGGFCEPNVALLARTAGKSHPAKR